MALFGGIKFKNFYNRISKIPQLAWFVSIIGMIWFLYGVGLLFSGMEDIGVGSIIVAGSAFLAAKLICCRQTIESQKKQIRELERLVLKEHQKNREQ